MPDNIENKFGLDASAALQALTALDTGFTTLATRLETSKDSFQLFNSNAGRTVAALIQIRDRANEAADALGRLNKIRPVQTPNTPSVGGGGGNGELLTGAAAKSKFDQLLGQTTPVIEANESATRKATKTNGGYAVSFETLSRVFATQLIVRALNQIRNAIEDSVGSFINFSRAIAEIQTIADGETFESLSDGIRKLSDDFNAPILDVAKAKYEALSNGFETAEESTQLLTAALKFSKVGISTTTQAIDLLSGTLNAYGQDASYAETLSAKLFETIRVGKVVGSELATAFGRVAPIGKEIGATQDELLAAFSSITIGGVKASEAATQIRATMTALLKPSEDMSVALRQLGFESGEQAVGALGLQGALQALIGTTNGSITAIGTLFPNVRALNGVLREVGSGADIYQEHLEKIRNASAELLNQKYEVFIKTNANLVETDLNKLKNFFTVDLGSQLTEKLKGTFDFVAVEKLTALMSAAAPVVAVLVGTIGLYTVATTLSSIGTKIFTADLFALATAAGRAEAQVSAFSAATRGAVAGAGLVLASYQVGQFLGQLILDSVEKPLKELEAAEARLIAFSNQKRAAQANLDNLATEAQGRQLLKYNAAARKSFFEEIDDAKEKNAATIDDSKATLDKLISIRSKYATDLQRAATTAENDATQSKKRTADLQGRLEDRQFNERLSQQLGSNSKTNAAIQAQALRSRALQLSAQGRDKLSSANTPEEREAGESALNRAEAYAQQALSAAQTSGSLIEQQDAERAIQEIIKQKITAEERFQATRKASAAQLEAGAAKERERVTRLQQLEKSFLDKSNILDKSGDILNGPERAKNKAAALKDLEEIKGLLFGPGSESSFGDLLSFDKLQKQFQQGITGEEINALFTTTPENLESVHDQLQGTIDQYGPILLKFAPDPEALRGLPVNQWFNEFDKQIQAGTQEIAASRDVGNQTTELTQKIASEFTKGAAALAQKKGFFENLFDGGGAEAEQSSDPRSDIFQGINKDDRARRDQVAEEYFQIRKDAESLFQRPENVSASSVAALSKRFFQNKEDAEKAGVDLAGPESSRTSAAIESLRTIVDLLEQRNQLEQANPDRQEKLQEGTEKRAADAFDAFGANIERDKAEAAAKAKQENQGAVPAYQAQATASAETARNAERAAIAAQAAAAAGLFSPATQAPAAPTGPGLSTGGTVPMQYFDQGGAAKGIDTINAKLAPNEMVMKPDSTSRFFSQLQAMNAGLAPQTQRSSSGDTFQIGDIHINGAASPKDTAREVINRIRREQRRGSGNTLR